ncbi:MAG: nitroreductase family protein [Allorhizobium sp.]
MTSSNSRQSDFPIDRLFLDRWSPRAFVDETMEEDTLLTILDAAHWAPSASNYQPWRFVYARKGSDSWDTFLGILNESNQVWAKSASVLIIILSETQVRRTDGQPPRASRTHSFDAGAAWAMLAMQATLSGYFAHGMAGMDYGKAAELLGVPETFRVEAAVAIGRLAAPGTLLDDLRQREVPSSRKPLNEVAFEGAFRES